MKFDLVIKGGDVIDAAADLKRRQDVAIKGRRIAAVQPDIPVAQAFRVIDAAGKYVAPGLIDLHCHAYWLGSKLGVHADSIASRTGVTTWMDAGSAGALTLPGFREYVIRRAEARLYCFLNISSIGLTGFDYELANLEYCDVDLCRYTVDRNRDFVLGVKVRMGAGTVGSNGTEPLKRARQAADLCELPLMVHIAQAPPAIDEVLSFLKAGDILTHCCTAQTMGIVDVGGRILESAKRAREAGVIFDVGHGAGSFSWKAAAALLEAGYGPHTISTDMHQVTLGGPMFDLPTCLSKFLDLGMSLPEVIRAVTSRPAQVLGLAGEIGTLLPGALADLCVFEIADGKFPLYDSQGEVRDATRLIHSAVTIINGRVLPRRPPEPLAAWTDWARAGGGKYYKRLQFQEILRERGHIPEMMIAAHRRAAAPKA